MIRVGDNRPASLVDFGNFSVYRPLNAVITSLFVGDDVTNGAVFEVDSRLIINVIAINADLSSA